MKNEVLIAAELLQEGVFSLKEVNMPWLNQVDPEWLDTMVEPCSAIFILEDNATIVGKGDSLLNALISNRFLVDGKTLAERIQKLS